MGRYRRILPHGQNPCEAAIEHVYALENDVRLANDHKLLEDWRKLQASDHFYYMCKKWFADGDVHAYFSPYESPYDAHIAYMNALSDLRLRVHKRGSTPSTALGTGLQTTGGS